MVEEMNKMVKALGQRLQKGGKMIYEKIKI
jgi:hypothetical protein